MFCYCFFCIGLQSTISLSEKKEIAEFVSEAECYTSRFAGLQPLNHDHTNYQLWSREHKKTEKLWLRHDSSGKSGDADIPWLGLRKKHQAAEQNQLQVGPCQWWLQGLCMQTAMFLEFGTEPIPAIRAETREDCCSSGKTSTKGNLEASSLRSFFVDEPPHFLLENVETKRWPSRYEEPLGVPFCTECWIWIRGKEQHSPSHTWYQNHGSMIEGDKYLLLSYVSPCFWVHKQQQTFKWPYFVSGCIFKSLFRGISQALWMINECMWGFHLD